MKKSLFFLIATLACLTTYAQPLSKDSLYFVRLLNGTTLYSNKVQLIRSRNSYLLLDNNQKIPLSEAKEFKGWDGAFAIGNPNGFFDAYRLDHEGRRISLYSQCYSTTETVFASTTPGGPQIPTTYSTQQKDWYFRKDPDGTILRLNFRNLKYAMADNPASTHELQVGRTNVYLGIGLMVTGVVFSFAGILQGVHRSQDAQNAYKTASNNWFNAAQANPFNPPPMPPLPPHYGPSALFYLGLPTMLSGMIPLFNAGKHAKKALDIYNGID
ncbi:hypothetical protein [Puia dinghuensis]|uniref:Uncharacterized protein n=1 Tax=Puia dinghuensis TaxID=1792502 RepID=A0A8J2XY13_9BACT|nr:hypothetical protein [Puia dinghuensis]GGB25854.1 hypothetical protein GCM10011511_57220 [Puia dinghuensis]